MKAAELEALVLRQGQLIESLATSCEEWQKDFHDRLQAQTEAYMNLVQRADNIVEGFKQELAGRDERIVELTAGMAEVNARISPIQSYLEHSVGRIEKLETLVMARNSSAATKRNMTDEDALKVLTGDLKDLPHKDAAEKIGLTYAQVYSCRLEFTFKHVHKVLRDGSTPEAPWSNPWSK